MFRWNDSKDMSFEQGTNWSMNRVQTGVKFKENSQCGNYQI